MVSSFEASCGGCSAVKIPGSVGFSSSKANFSGCKANFSGCKANYFSEQTGQVHSQMVATDDDMFDGWDNHLNEQMQGQVTTELDRYLSESPISRSEEFDILKWWSTNSVTYPTLAALARDVLAIPASTVASESAFSMGGRIVNDFRSRLNVESVEALICSQDWYRGSASHQCMSAITDLVDLQDTEIDSPLA